MKDVAAWVGAHHERPDGRGYPRGLAGEEIPLEARILAVADAYEAMTCDRVYRRALPVEVAREELRKGAGTQFDPRVVEVFLAWLEESDGAASRSRTIISRAWSAGSPSASPCNGSLLQSCHRLFTFVTVL